MPTTHSWLPLAKIILVILLIAIVILSVLALVQGFSRSRDQDLINQRLTDLATDRSSADQLLTRLENLKGLSRELVSPQVELNIKF